MPLSYAAILGGTLTLIGTSTNLIVSSFLSDQTGQGLLFGDFYRVSFPVVLLCIGAMVVTARWLPRYDILEGPADEFVLEALVEADAGFVGLSVEEAGLRQLETLYPTELVREGERIRPVSPGQILQAEDRLVFSGDVRDVARLDQISGLTTFAERQGLFSGDLTEAVVAPGAILAGRTVRDIGFRARFDAAIIGIQRDGERLSGEIGFWSYAQVIYWRLQPVQIFTPGRTCVETFWCSMTMSTSGCSIRPRRSHSLALLSVISLPRWESWSSVWDCCFCCCSCGQLDT